MVDVVVNNVMATSITPDFSKYMFKQEVSLLFNEFSPLTTVLHQSQYHPYCEMDFSNTTSEQQCWFGDLNVPLPDLKTEDPDVISGFNSWIKDMVKEYGIDGLRIDGSSPHAFPPSG